MKKISKSLVFFGNERLSSGFETTAPTLRSLVESGYNIKAVIVNQASKGERKLEIAEIAAKNHIPIIAPDKLSDLLTTLYNFKTDIGILVAYGKIIPKEFIDMFPCGILNIHPSLLPLYRGPTPIEQVIIDGAKKTGVSIMRLACGMDAGPIYAQKEIKLTGQEDKQTLTKKLLNEGAKLLLGILPDILDGKLQPKPQNETKASYCSLISKKSGLIDWSKSASQIAREIRAFYGWPGSYTKIGNLDITITRAEATNLRADTGKFYFKDKELYVGCKVGSLKILELKPAGKKNMPTSAFLNGYYKLIKDFTAIG